MSDNESYTITAASRIHFGLFSGQRQDGLSYGGIGAMVDQPGLELRIEPSESKVILGPQRDRVQQFVEKWFEFTGHQPEQHFSLTVEHAPESHIGLELEPNWDYL